MKRDRVETVVIGGSQAGLAVGYHLRRRGLPFVIVDENERVGDAWRNRWESLRLFTPGRYNGLPRMPRLRATLAVEQLPSSGMSDDFVRRIFLREPGRWLKNTTTVSGCITSCGFPNRSQGGIGRCGGMKRGPDVAP